MDHMDLPAKHVRAITGAMSMGKKTTVDANCVGPACNTEGKSAADSGKALGTVSTVGFGVGLAGLGAAAVLWLTAAPASASGSAGKRCSPVLALGDGGSALVGAQGSW
jgi:hypothetical protein